MTVRKVALDPDSILRIESGQGEERHDKTDFWASSGSESAMFALDDDVARRVASSQVYIDAG